MFNEKYLVDAVIAIIALWICVGVWGNDKMKGLFKTIVIAVALGTAVLWINSRHGFLHGASSSTQVLDGAKVTGKGLVSRIPWLRILLAGIVVALTFWYAKRVGVPKPWLYDRENVPTEPTPSDGKAKPAATASKAKPALTGKRDNGAYWATNVCGYGCALAILLASKWSLLPFALATLFEVAIMNVQVPEQERWTPVRFGKRCFGYQKGNEWMLGAYCFENGWNWMLLPRNWPGLSFNVAKPRNGLNIACKTAKVPTLGFKIGDVDLVGGEVDVAFNLLYDSHDDLDAFYSSKEEIRNDPAKLAAYASDIYGAEFRVLLKGKTLADIQTGDVFKDPKTGKDLEFTTSRELFERGTGHKVRRVLVEDPTPSDEVQRQINELAAKRIEKAQAELEKEITVIKGSAAGAARLAELQPLAAALQDQNMLAAINAVRGLDMAKFSNLRVMVDSQLKPLLPLVAEASED